MPWQPPPEWDDYIGAIGSPLEPVVDFAQPPAPLEVQTPAPSPMDAQQLATSAPPAVPAAAHLAITPADQPELLTPPLPDQPATFDSLPSFAPPPPSAEAPRPDFTIAREDDFGGMTPTDPDRMTPEQLGVHLSSLPLEQQEMERAKIEGARHQFESARRLELSEKALQDAEDNARIRQESVKAARERGVQLDAEAKTLASENPLDSISGTRKVFGILASIVGGFMVNKTGRNMGLEAVDQIANEAAQQHAQKLQLNARQRAQVGSDVDQAEAAYLAGERARLAVYDGGIKLLESEVQNFDPRGTTALRVMDQIDALRARRAELLNKYAVEQQKRVEAALKLQLDVTKSKQEQQRIDDARTNNRQQIGLGYAQLARQKTKDAQDLDLEKDKLKLEADKLKVAGDEKAAKQLLEQGVAAPPGLSIGPDGSVVVNKDSGSLKNADGKPWIIPTTEEAKAFRKKKAAADSIIKNLDEIREIRERVGGESSWGNSDDYQRLQVLKNNLVILKKSGTEGMSSDEDMNKIIASLGAKDPTSFRSQSAGLDEGRRQVIAQLNTDARSLKYTGNDIDYADPLKLRAPKSPEQEQVEQILAFDPKRTSADLGSEMGIDPAGHTSASYSKAVLDELERRGGVPQRIRDQIAALRDTAANASDPKKRDFAVESLEKIATSAEDPSVRAYALANSTSGPAPGAEEVESE